MQEWFRAEGLTPSAWGNGPGDRYDWHSHEYHKVLFCLSGSIVFHTREGDVEVHSGDRLDVEPRADHAATVGPEGSNVWKPRYLALRSCRSGAARACLAQ